MSPVYSPLSRGSTESDVEVDETDESVVSIRHIGELRVEVILLRSKYFQVRRLAFFHQFTCSLIGLALRREKALIKAILYLGTLATEDGVIDFASCFEHGLHVPVSRFFLLQLGNLEVGFQFAAGKDRL